MYLDDDRAKQRIDHSCSNADHVLIKFNRILHSKLSFESK